MILFLQLYAIVGSQFIDALMLILLKVKRHNTNLCVKELMLTGLSLCESLSNTFQVGYNQGWRIRWTVRGNQKVQIKLNFPFWERMF